jgi:HNH endonuclease
MKLTQARLKELLHYSPETGECTWLVNRTNGVKAGDRAGFDVNGYQGVYIDNVMYKIHRIAFLYMNGMFPVEYVDHVNCNKADNRWSNLREATNSQNQHNRSEVGSNTGCKNVTYIPGRNKYQVGFRLNKKSLFFGYFDDLELADLVATEAREKYHGKFARHC